MQDLEDPQSDILPALGLAGAFALTAAGIAVAVGAGLFNEAHDAAITARLEAEARARKAMRPEQIVPLTHPVCTATMQTSVGGVVDHRGCYVPKGKK